MVKRTIHKQGSTIAEVIEWLFAYGLHVRLMSTILVMATTRKPERESNIRARAQTLQYYFLAVARGQGQYYTHEPITEGRAQKAIL